ncbi:hypothetical protein [Streptomyces monomycini]|uniref:hypothetical protein n=1 Tax=Streptomyces monomycini TaxID=371720 RepID=UPI0004AA1E37|nr:hypothetical protein [Streptomyces monomycini]
MGEIRHEVAEETSRLQAGITAVLQELDGLPQDDPRYEALFGQLVEAGTALLAYEASVPAKLEAPQRKVSKSALTWAAGVHVAGALLLALAPLTGWISWWWLLLAGFQALAGVLIGATDPAPGRHRMLRSAAIGLSIVTVLVPLLVFGVISGWFWIAAVVGWLFSGVQASDAEQEVKAA